MFVEEKEIGEAQVKPTTPPLKFSTAIRLGALMSEQHRGSFFGGRGGSCAIGAAVLATIGKDRFSSMGAHEMRQWLKSYGITDRIKDRIVHRNDAENWSREGIANWLESKGL